VNPQHWLSVIIFEIDILLSNDKEPIIVFSRTLYFCFSLSIVLYSVHGRVGRCWKACSRNSLLPSGFRYNIFIFYWCFLAALRARVFRLINTKNRAPRVFPPIAASLLHSSSHYPCIDLSKELSILW
jgi:hypothetical protein